MEYNLLESLNYCHAVFEEVSNLIYYTRIPPIAFALLLGGYVLYARRDRTSMLLAGLALVFSLWVGFDLLQWVRTDLNTLIMVTWSLFGILGAALFFLTHWFVHSFLTEKPLPLWMTLLWGVVFVPVLIFTPTTVNLEGFSLSDCAAIEGNLFANYYYLLGIVAMFLMAVSMILARKNSLISETKKNAGWLVFVGAELFTLAFLGTGIIASYLVNAEIIVDYGIDQYGMATMAAFIGLLGYATVRYHAFNLKLLAAQALVAALIILVASEFLFVASATNYFLVSFTLILVTWFGWLLVRSVKREIEQRQHVEKLAKDLEAANERLKELDQMKSEFLSIASHQLRAPITAIKGYVSLIREGDYGVVPATMQEPLSNVAESVRVMVSSIEDYLNVSRIEQNRLKYELSDVDIAELAKRAVEELRPVAMARKLDLSIQAAAPTVITADTGKMKQVITNLIDNAIKYTLEGSVAVSVEEVSGKIRVMVKDTGVGIAPEDIGKLFQKFKRATGANEVNSTGTGLGLYVARLLVEGHGGKVWAESDGKGKGSRFIVELPVRKAPTVTPAPTATIPLPPR